MKDQTMTTFSIKEDTLVNVDDFALKIKELMGSNYLGTPVQTRDKQTQDPYITWDGPVKDDKFDEFKTIVENKNGYITQRPTKIPGHLEENGLEREPYEEETSS